MYSEYSLFMFESYIRNEELHIFVSSPSIRHTYGDQSNKDGMRGRCCARGEDDK
jgi:hypothetical protein